MIIFKAMLNTSHIRLDSSEQYINLYQIKVIMSYCCAVSQMVEKMT